MATVNQVVRNHQIDIDWKYQPVCRLLWSYYDRFRERFFPELPDCYLRCEPTNIRQKFAYQLGDNGVGAQYEFVLNSDWIGLPRYKIASLILHGMIHISQEVTGRPAADGFHNREFEERSRALGIPCKHGYSCDVVAWENPFRDLVMRDPDAFKPVVEGVAIPEVGESRLKKWSCGCTNIRAAVEVNAMCLKCGKPFVRQ